MSPTVAVLLVSHDGARWLPTVLAGIRSQTATVGRFLAVDTGSKDDSRELLAAAGAEVLALPSATSFPAAVEAGLARLRQDPDPAPWVWLLHDDASPDPGALAALLDAAAQHPAADLFGPKLREWPSLRRLVEVGVTITGTGRRETGLEPGEYDQGQHDEVREVLAVNTAGLLARTEVLHRLGGLDPQLPVFGNDLDLGWRAAAAGHTTLVVPQAVVFHAEAAHRGVRRTPLTGRHTSYQERRAALYTLLVNCPGAALPFLVVRLVAGTALRMAGFLLVRSVGEALDDLAALVSVYSSPGQVRRARQQRRALAPGQEDRARVRRLLAPPWLPYRHGLDFLGDLLTAATRQAADVAERRRATTAEHDPSSMAATVAERRLVRSGQEEPWEGPGPLGGWLTNPVVVCLGLFVAGWLVIASPAYGTVVGPGLSPPPDTGWWPLQLRSWQPLGPGTAVPAPAYVLPLAVLGSLAGPGWTVSLLMVLAVPVALWGAWRLLRVLGRLASPQGVPRWLLLWGAVTYALAPVVAGAWEQGRLGTVVAAAGLPWLGHAALGFIDPDPDRRWRAAWRSGLLLVLLTAFTPVAWLAALALGTVVLALASVLVGSRMRDRSVWAPPVTALAVVPVLLAPWWLPAVRHGASAGLLLDAGRLPQALVDAPGMLTGRLAGAGAPWQVGAALLGLALLALVPRHSRAPVLLCWLVALVATGLAAALSPVRLHLVAVDTVAGLTVLVLLLQGCFVVASVLGIQGLVQRARPARRARAVTVTVGLVAAAVPVAGVVWAAADGADGLSDEVVTEVPAYMQISAQTGPQHGILLLRGDVEHGMTYQVRRDDGVTVGEDEVLALSGEDNRLSRTVETLVSRPAPRAVDALAQQGVQYVVMPAPVDGRVAAGLDATGGLLQASAGDREARAWQVSRELDPDAVDGPRSWLRVGLLVVQAVGLLVVLVLCAPTTRRRPR